MPKLPKKPPCIYKTLRYIKKEIRNNEDQIWKEHNSFQTRKIVESYINVKSYANVAQKANPVSHNNQPN